MQIVGDVIYKNLRRADLLLPVQDEVATVRRLINLETVTGPNSAILVAPAAVKLCSQFSEFSVAFTYHCGGLDLTSRPSAKRKLDSRPFMGRPFCDSVFAYYPRFHQVVA